MNGVKVHTVSCGCSCCYGIKDIISGKLYIKGIEPYQRIFPITYNAARVMVNKAGKLVGIYLRPHDLRRFCATYASRAGTPIEIVAGTSNIDTV